MANIFSINQNRPSLPGFGGISSPGFVPQTGGPGFGGVSLPLKNKSVTSSPLENQYKLYGGAVEQNAKDYGDIMGGYKNLLSSSAANNPILKPGVYSPNTYSYSPTANETSALNTLGGYSQTGGISDAEAADIRERGISPIRSIYSSADREINRNRTLKGGFSPGFAAVKAKMARELADSIGSQVTNVNADIAGRRQQGRLSSAAGYASAAGAENALQNQYGAGNVDIGNEAQKFNITSPLEFGKYNQGVTGQSANILDAMRSLYGTTPAMSSLYGNQALNASQLQNLISNQGNQTNVELIRSILGGLR